MLKGCGIPHVAYHIYLVLEDEAIDVSHSHVGE